MLYGFLARLAFFGLNVGNSNTVNPWAHLVRMFDCGTKLSTQCNKYKDVLIKRGYSVILRLTLYAFKTDKCSYSDCSTQCHFKGVVPQRNPSSQQSSRHCLNSQAP